MRIDWKYALDLPLDDPGFSHTVLHDFRERLLAGSAEEQLLSAMLELARATGWLDSRRQRTDSTHVLAATAALNRVLCVAGVRISALAPRQRTLETLYRQAAQSAVAAS